MEFKSEDIAMRYQIRGVYDGICAYLMKDGTWVNRFRLDEGWSPTRVEAVDRWIAAREAEDRLRESGEKP